MDQKLPTYLSTDTVKTFWIFGLAVLAGASLYYGVSTKIDAAIGKIDVLTVAVKEQTDVARTLTMTVNKHETRIALVEEKANACYNGEIKIP